MSNYLIYLAGDGDVSLICYVKDVKEAEEFAYDWIDKHNYMGDLTDIYELTLPDYDNEVEL